MKNKLKGKVFTAQEVQSMIAGNMTMFREVIKPRIKVENYKLNDGSGIGMEILLEECPYQVGQKIFCKERWAVNKHYDNFDPKSCFAGMGGDVKYCVAYDSNNEFKVDDWAGKKRSAKSMPQWASRLTLLIKEIKVERLQDISEEDAIAEGLFKSKPNNHWHAPVRIGKDKYQYFTFLSAHEAFQEHWNSTHKKPEEKFEANPFVFVYQFELIK